MKFKLWNCDIKKIFKRLLPIALATIIVFSFAGCGSKEQGGQSNVEPDPPYTEPADPDKKDPDKENPGTQTDPSKDPDDQDPDDKQDPTTPTDPDDKKDPDYQDPDTPPVVEEFSLAENKDKIIENVMPLINYYKIVKIGNKATIDKVYDIAISHDNTTTKINAVFSGIANSTKDYYLEYGTISMPIQSDLTFKDICSNSIKYSPTELEFSSNYTFSMSISKYIEYKSTIQTIQQKLFDNYDSALWLGWNGTTTPQYDYHQIVNFDGLSLRLISIDIKNDGNTLTFPSGPVEKYFINDEYTLVVDKVEFTLPNDTLSAQIQKELQEKEQQEI